MIAHATPQTEKEFREARKTAQRKVRLARAKWWSEKADVINDMSKVHDKKLFQKIKELRFILTPGRRFGIHTIRNKDGKALTDPDDISRRWIEYFKGVYMILFIISPTVAQTIPQKPILHELEDPPTFSEFERALSSLKNGKTPGSDDHK